MSETPLLDWRPPAPDVEQKSEARLKFEAYDAENPDVYALFKRFAFQALDSDCERISARFVVERIRWEARVAVRRTDGFKINNNFSSFYGRKFIADYPQYRDRFELRVQKSDQ